MTYSIIQKSQLEGTFRLDAEYYQPEYLKLSKILSVQKCITLGDFCGIADGDHAAIPGFVDSKGKRYLRAKDLQKFFIDDSDPVYVSKDYFAKLKRSHIKPNDIVLSIMGTIGNLALITKSQEVMTANRAVSIISPKDQNRFLSTFIAIYLESKFGTFQRSRESMGGVQSRINLDDLAKIRIPIISLIDQNEIDKVFQMAITEHNNSKGYYKEAEELLLKELGLENYETEKKLSSIVNLSDCQKANRIDAEYFQPSYIQLIVRLKEHDSKPLREVIENVPANFNSLTEPDKDFNYVELSNIDSSLGIISDSSRVLGRETASRAKRILKTNDVIVSSVEGSLDKVALINYVQDNYLASTGFFQFRSSKILPEVLLVLAKSIVFQYQLKQRCAGTILTAVPQNSVKDILVPILPIETQRKIAELVKKSHEARKKSKELLEEAKRKVEKIIEKRTQ
jgi:restriction endonuclease S subunit